jgi:predicted membrane-bound dolichyl-phosphate-mannose-protein mannosyltransferase
VKVDPRPILVFVGAIALLTFNLNQPPSYKYDEMLYLDASRALMHGLPDPMPAHPPLAKHFMGLGIRIFGDNPIGWRIMSALAGASALAVIFLWVSQMADLSTAWVAVALVVSNGFWYVMSRVAMLPIFELAFCVLGFYLLWREWYTLSGASFGLATACRWNAAFAIALVIVWLLSAKRVKQALTICVVSVLVYAVTWLPTVGLHPVNFVNVNLYGFNFHHHAGAASPSASLPWYKWLYQSSDSGSEWLVANPLITLAGIAGIVILFRERKHWLLACSAPVFWLQWAVIRRPFTYYYYFLDTCMFLSIAAAFAIIKLRTYRSKPGNVAASTVVMVIAALWFAIHYAVFANLGSPWTTPLYVLSLFGL